MCPQVNHLTAECVVYILNLSELYELFFGYVIFLLGKKVNLSDKRSLLSLIKSEMHKVVMPYFHTLIKKIDTLQ